MLERYRLGARLGTGSFGTVWRAHDELLGREVAVKIVSRRRIMDGRLEREVRAAARLSHPAIVTLYEAGADGEDAYLVSELVRGATLQELLRAGRLSDREIVAIGIALCEALAHAHSRGVVHRDVKPSNILVPDRPASAGYPAKLTDFGVARVLGGDSLTRTGDIVGTDAYMAPEQAAGRQTGPPADLYALALVLYEALTGVNPAADAGRRGARLGTHLPPLRRQRRDLPRELGRGIDLALRPRPRERGTVQELRSALLAGLDQCSENPGVVEGPWRPRIALPSPRAESAGSGELGRGIRSAPIAWPERGLGAAGAAALAAWLASHVLSAGTAAPAVVGLLAAAAVLVLPRVGFGLTALALIVVAGLQGHGGTALEIAVALVIPMALMPRSGTAWPLPAGAVALGLLGLGGAWPALASRARGAWRRAALGAAGWLWLALAGPVHGGALYVPLAHGLPAWSVWSSSPYETVQHVLLGTLSGSVVIGAAVWGLAAAVLPGLIRGRSAAADAIRVAAWTGMLLAAVEMLLATGPGDPPAATAVLGALAGGIVALGPAWVAGRRQAPRSGEAQTGLP